MVIGKGGNYIKQIKEESGAYIQISQKSKETNLPERCITVAGMLSGGTFCNSYTQKYSQTLTVVIKVFCN